MTPAPRFPHRPEPLARLRQRYAEAVAECCEHRWLNEHFSAPDPGLARRHTFDFEDGLRMVVTRERLDCLVVVHFSASVVRGSGLFRLVDAADRPIRAFRDECVSRIAALSGVDRGRLSFAGYTPFDFSPQWYAVVSETETEGGCEPCQ